MKDEPFLHTIYLKIIILSDSLTLTLIVLCIKREYQRLKNVIRSVQRNERYIEIPRSKVENRILDY